MSSREQILNTVRNALKRKAGDPVPPPPAVRLADDPAPPAELAGRFTRALEGLAGRVTVASTTEAVRAAVEAALAGRDAIASNAAILGNCGITTLAGVRLDTSRGACAVAAVGITSADYGLADTGSLVMLSESAESRLITLLPPCHIAVIKGSTIVPTLDDVFAAHPYPADSSSALTVITGPSRTADIEMRLVRGVHGPGEIHVVIAEFL